MANLIVFCLLAVVILGAALFCVLTTRIMRAATMLLFVLLGVAGLYFLLDYTFLGAAQISVYAGGITMVYIFAIQLLGKRDLQEGKAWLYDPRKHGWLGSARLSFDYLRESIRASKACSRALVAFVGLATVVGIYLKHRLVQGDLLQFTTMANDTEVPMSTVGQALMGADKYGYVLPFEFISVFLLACIIGGIMISRKDKSKASADACGNDACCNDACNNNNTNKE